MTVTTTSASSLAELDRERLFGLDFISDTSIAELTETLLREAREPTVDWRCVVTPNVDHLIRYDLNDADASVATDAVVVLPDGMPIVWASKLLGRPLSCRLTGSDLFAELWPKLARRSWPTVLVAPSEEVAACLAMEHRNMHAIVAPWFDTDDVAAASALADQIDAVAVSACFVIIAVSMPKHHLLARLLHERWAHRREPSPIVVLLGASPEFYLGLTKRAPMWMQRAGLEWVHRLTLDPRRMAKRYLVDDIRIARLIHREWRRIKRPATSPRLGRGRRPRQRRPSSAP